jgi:hypothetical protein
MEIRQIILDRIHQISQYELGFTGGHWTDTYVSFDQGDSHITRHISEVNFSDLNDPDLVRLFEYVIYLNNI